MRKSGMDASEKREGDALAKQLIAAYWQAFAGEAQTWNFYLQPLRYTPSDRWATRQQWVDAARRCVERDTNVLFGLEVLLAEGCTEYLPKAMAIVKEWIDEYGGGDPEYYYDILAYFPADHPARRRFLSVEDTEEADAPTRSALIAVEDPTLCRHLGARIAEVFAKTPLDEERAEDYALPRLLQLGRLCTKYVPPGTMAAIKHFYLGYLQKDREAASGYRQRMTELWESVAKEGLAGGSDQRIVWMRLDIAKVAWRLGWFDVLTSLRREPWYWDDMFADFTADYENENLLVWSQYARDDMLHRRALAVMREHEHHKLDGAIAWVRMTHMRWPPG